MPTYDIRIEYTDNSFKDMKVAASTFNNAQGLIQDTIGIGRKFEWRGAVVFVNHLPPFSEK